MKRNLVQQFFAEVCNYGGLSATRSEIYDHARTCALSRGADDDSAHRCADRACCAYPAIQDSPRVVGTLAEGWAHEDGADLFMRVDPEIISVTCLTPKGVRFIDRIVGVTSWREFQERTWPIWCMPVRESDDFRARVRRADLHVHSVVYQSTGS